MKAMLSLMMALTLSACTAVTAIAPAPTAPQGKVARAANPASMNCLQNRGVLETVQTPQGEQTYCLLPGGKRCEEWDMFRGNCPTRTVNVKMKKFGF
jgi:putative hemolysin